MMEEALTAELPDSFILKAAKIMENTDRKFIDNFGRVPLGLWVHVLKTAQEKNINLQLSPEMQQYIQ